MSRRSLRLGLAPASLGALLPLLLLLGCSSDSSSANVEILDQDRDACDHD